MSTFYAIKLGGEDAQKDASVSTGDFPINRHDGSFIMSAKKVMLKLPIFGRKSTNMQSTDFHNPSTNSTTLGLLVWRLHDMPLQAVTCHFFVEAFSISHLQVTVCAVCIMS